LDEGKEDEEVVVPVLERGVALGREGWSGKGTAR